MSLQYSVAVRSAKLEAIETTIGTSAQLRVFSGAQPANVAAADPAGLLVTMPLPSNWMDAASGGAKLKSGTWAGTAAGTGTALSWRIYDTAFTNCHMQGDMSDLVLDTNAIVSGQVITAAAFTIVAGNA